MGKYILTSESVTEGHPDKVCDQISDAILDAYLEQDENARVAVECLIGKKLLVISGEITSTGNVDIKQIAKNTLSEIGYTTDESGFDLENADILVNIGKQSPDIAMGVNRKKICAGDQGMVYGYACNENIEFIPTTIYLSHKLTQRLAEVRKKGIMPYLYPDGKSQVSIIYNENGEIEGIDSIVIAAQHSKDIDIGQLRTDIINNVIFPVIDIKYLKKNTKIHINSTGLFVIGGPNGDCGLTGRKIIVDTYGGIGHHGGGAFSGKDPSKTDRSGSYMARYIAKNIVAANLAKCCEIGFSYVIGTEKSNTIYINTFGTEIVNKEIIEKVIRDVFDLSVDSIIKNLRLQRPIYKNVASYGHFGREDLDLPWEKLDKVKAIKVSAAKAVLEI